MDDAFQARAATPSGRNLIRVSGIACIAIALAGCRQDYVGPSPDATQVAATPKAAAEPEQKPVVYYIDVPAGVPLAIVYDSVTGCQYITMQGSGKAITPRLGSGGTPMCDKPKGGD